MNRAGRRTALRLSAIYVLLAGVWISISDRIVSSLTTNPAHMTRLQNYKGWAFVLVTGGMLLFLLHREFRRREKIEEGLRAGEAQYRILFENSRQGVLLTTPDGHILAANPAACRLFGWTETEICREKWDSLIENTDPRSAAEFEERARTGPFAGEVRFRRKDGSSFEGHVTSTVFTDRGGESRVSIFVRDVTEPKRAAATLTRLNQDLRTISLCNQVLVRAKGEGELLGEICRTIVEVGGHRAAWVGFVEGEDSRHVRPVTVVGCEPDRLDRHAMDLADPAWETCPVASAVRTAGVQVVHDLPGNPPRCPWHDEAMRLGIGSSISLPLKQDGRPFGVLTIYFPARDAFTAEEETLLVELADDLAYGIQALRTQKAHEQAQADIESLARFPGENPSPIMRIREDGVLLYANEPCGPLLRLWGTGIGGPVPAEWGARVRCALETGARAGIDLPCEGRIFSIVLAPVPEALYANLYGRDVTERRQAEEELAAHARRLETVRTISSEITRELNLGALLQRIIQEAVALVGARSGMLRLWDADHQRLVPYAWIGYETVRPDIVLRLGEGVAGTAAQQETGFFVNDFRASPYATAALLAATTHRAVLAEPLLYRERLLGVVNVNHEAPDRAFTPADQEILALFASQAAIAIENARLHKAALRRMEELQALLRATRSVMSGLNLEGTLDRILTEAAQISGSPRVKILLLDNRTGELQLKAVKNPTARVSAGLRPRIGLSHIVVATREPLFVSDCQHDSRNPYADQDREFGHVTYLGLPILVGEEVAGVLTFNTTEPREYTPEEIAYLMSFTTQAAIAIENARLYEETRRHAAELEQRVAERTAELEWANRELAAASQHKSAFLANMSHELRTPLNGILGFAQILQEQAGPALTEKQRRYLNHIYGSGQHLLTLINDILDLSKVEAGKVVLQPEPLPVAQTLEDLLVIARGLANKRAQTLTAEIAPDLPPLTADPVRFKQILFNLLSNAVKFTPDRGTITLTACQVTEDRSPETDATPRLPSPVPCLELAVTDTGVGIKAEDLPKLFQEFTQLETTRAQAQEGTSLGLALTRRLVELHGGRIWAASPGEGQGSTFTVVLPLGGPLA